jgi:hypothetical protein
MTHLNLCCLVELRRRLWNREAAWRRRLIYTVTFDEEYYNNLQERLPSARTVMGCKAAAIDAVPHIPFQWDAGDGEQQPAHDPYDLPATVTVLDVRPLRLQYWPLEESIILVRDEYQDIRYKLSDPGLRGARGSMLITGQPGIGEPERLAAF